MLVLVTLVVTARFWICLSLVNGRLGADDWCILVAWILAVVFDLDLINDKWVEMSFAKAPVYGLTFEHPGPQSVVLYKHKT